MTDRHLLLVVGTGRSGTSTFVGVLRRHGFHVPEPEVAPDESNPRGFGEPQWVVDLHTRLLRRSGVQVADSRPRAWDLAREGAGSGPARGQLQAWLGEQLDAHPRLVVKDPRSLWFIPLWREVAEEAGVPISFVTMVRPPAETVGSRRAHYNAELEDAHGVASWVNLMSGTELVTRGLRRSFVRYHDLLDGWSPVLDSVWGANGLPGARPAPSSDPDEFVDPGLRRQRSTWDDLRLPDRLRTLGVAAEETIDALASASPDESVSAAAGSRLDDVRREYAAYYAESEALVHSSIVAARQEARKRPAGGAEPRPSVAGRPAGPLARVGARLARSRSSRRS